jgi:signal transduction histidine kinase
MGERMRAIDWSLTPLGPVEGWPQSLKTCVRIILTSAQPMFVWWGDSLVNLYNDAYRSILAGKHPQALGRPASEVWREIWHQILPRVESCLQKQEGTYDEALLLIMERNGYKEETYYTFSYSPVPNDRGGDAGGIICANSPDTERIIGQRQINLLRDLAARTAPARTVSEALRFGAGGLAANPRDLPFAVIYRFDDDKRTLRVEATTGISRDDAPVTLCIEDGPIKEALRSGVPQIIDDLSLFKTLPRGAWDRPPHKAVVVPIPRAGDARGTGVLVAALNPYRLFDDSYRGFIGLVSSTLSAAVANAQAYQDEKRRAEQLAELDRAKTAFFSNVSHEFRTPLTLILGPIEDALAHGQQISGETLASVHRNSMRLLRLVNSLLDFARIEAGRAQASYNPTDLAALTTELSSAFRSAIERAGLEFNVHMQPLGEPVWVDQDLWEKVVLNLLSNALKFTFEGSIDVSLERKGASVELSVRDTGTGIPQSELPRLFERFHRVEGAKSRTHEGSGIGLALVHELSRLHGGTVSVTSAPGQGSSFRVTIPLGSSHLPPERLNAQSTQASTALGAAPFVEEALRWLPDEPNGPRDAGAPIETSLVNPGARVLLADDNADMREYVRRLLGDRFCVIAVRDGAEALREARAARPDLILTDVMMPNLDGFGLLRELKADPALRAIPVVMLSARAGEESRVEGLQAGADDYLPKPFSARELIARVTTHLQIGALRRLAETEREKLRELFMQAPVSIALLDGSELRFSVANPSFCELAGRADVIGRTANEAFPELGDHEALQIIREVFRTGQPASVRALHIPIVRNGVQGDCWFDYLAHPLRGELGEVASVIVVAVEVTEQVVTRRRVDALRDAAESANRAKDEFLAMLGHELRNPLAPIVTALHLMKLRANGTLERERGVIERQVLHLGRLVDDLLDVSRITRGKIELSRQRLELSEVIARAIEMASPLLEQRQHHLTLSVPSRGLAVEGDPMRLAQIFSNILTNAAKYTQPGGQISVTARDEGERIVVSVRDNGMGIDPRMLPQIFELFVQAQRTLDRSDGGLGLGLAIVRSLVALHGGTVRAESAGLGKGSEFVVELPPSDRQLDGFLLQTDRAAAPGTGRRILVVDDNIDAAELLGDLLRHEGHEVCIAHDGPAALDVSSVFHPDTALLDIGLPVMDGYELARRLREQLPEVKLVAITGYGQQSDMDNAKAAGFDRHLVKPVSPDLVRTALMH